MTDARDATAALLADLQAAHAAATAVAGSEPVGVRAIEHAPGRRAYLCAFDGPRFLCLTAALRPEERATRVREIAAAGLLWEHLEHAVDPEALTALVEAIGRLLALGDEPREVTDSLGRVAARALELVEWREEPTRALASMVAVDAATGLQERVHAAYSLYVRASEPLVGVQDTLPAELVGALRAVEQSAAMARAPERLADILGSALPDVEESAEQVVAGHLTPLAG